MVLLLTIFNLVVGICLVNYSIQALYAMPVGHARNQHRGDSLRPKLLLMAGVLFMATGASLMIAGGLI